MVRLTLLQTGSCTHPEFLIEPGGRWGSVPTPALFALIEHPRRGLLLFDTGYGLRFFEETRRWPYWLYAQLTKVSLTTAETAVHQLQARGIAPGDIGTVIISHFHADHVGGLRDFPAARFIYLAEAYAAVQDKRGLAAVRAAFLPGHLPPDFEARSQPVGAAEFIDLPPEYAPFERGVDLLGDGSLLGVSLPGHAVGQMGVFLTDAALGPLLLAADACWRSDAYRRPFRLHPLTRLVTPDAAAYAATLARVQRLHQNRPDLLILPSHCPEVAGQFVEI